MLELRSGHSLHLVAVRYVAFQMRGVQAETWVANMTRERVG